MLAQGQFLSNPGYRLYIRIWVQHGSAGLLASDGLILEQWVVGLLLQRCVHGGNRNDQAGCFLYQVSVDDAVKVRVDITNHTSAGEGVPAESDSIAVLHITPLILQRLEIHVVGRCSGSRCVDQEEGGG